MENQDAITLLNKLLITVTDFNVNKNENLEQFSLVG